MAIDQTDTVDFVSVDGATGDLLLTISDHLAWEEEDAHLVLLQSKLNAYLRFIESGELFVKYPVAAGRNVVINLVSLFPLSQKATLFLERAKGAVQAAGFRLTFSLSSH